MNRILVAPHPKIAYLPNPLSLCYNVLLTSFVFAAR